jgi:hypothetical protein
MAVGLASWNIAAPAMTSPLAGVPPNASVSPMPLPPAVAEPEGPLPRRCRIYTTAVIPGLLPGLYSCDPPTDDGGTSDEGGVDAVGSSTDEDSGGDTGTSDAPADG